MGGIFFLATIHEDVDVLIHERERLIELGFIAKHGIKVRRDKVQG
jgi:hypothetical protein